MNLIGIRNKLKERRKFMDEHKLLFLIDEYNIPFDQLNVLLECIGRFLNLSIFNVDTQEE